MAAPTAIAALPFMGGTLSGFAPSDGTVTEWTNAQTNNICNATFAPCALRVLAGSNAQSPSWTAAATFWDRFDWNAFPAFNPAGDSLFRQYYNGSTEVARITVNNNTSGYGVATFKFYTLQSGSLTLVGTFNQPMSIGGTDSILGTMAIKIVGNSASGSFQAYAAGSLQLNVTGLNHSGFTGVTSVTMCGGVSVVYWSQVICDTISHVGDNLKSWSINANSGTNTGWTGTYTNINEIPTNDSAFISSASANQVSTFLQSGLSLSGYTILGVGISARGKCDSTGPQNIQVALRTASTNYFSSSISGFNNGYSPCFNSWTQNPSTSANWLASDAQAIEGGVKSIT